MKRPDYKDEDHLCREFNSSLQALYDYNQISNPGSFRFYHNDNGQRASDGAFFSFLFGKVPSLMKHKGFLAAALNYARAIAGKRAKEMGVKKGVPDYLIHWRNEEGTPFIGYLEAKYGKNDLTPEQEEFFAFCRQEKIPAKVFYSVPQAFEILQSWGVIKETAIF